MSKARRLSGLVDEFDAYKNKIGMGQLQDLRNTVFETGVPSDLYNTGTRNGFARGGSDGLGIPGLATLTYGTLMTNGQWTDASAYIASAISRIFVTGSGVYRQVAVSPTAWGTWSKLFDQSNLLGTVSQTSGVPTGSVIERNSNANGEYVKFADGTMICTLAYDASAMAVTSGIGSIFQAGSEVTWTYPAQFIAIPALMSSVDRNDGTTILGMYNRVVLAANAQWRIWSATSQPSGQTKNVKLLAVGRWF